MILYEKRDSRNVEMEVDSKVTSCSEDNANYKYCIANTCKEGASNCALLFSYNSPIERQRRASTLLQKDPAIILDV